jgi:hypothetical protein
MTAVQGTAVQVETYRIILENMYKMVEEKESIGIITFNKFSSASFTISTTTPSYLGLQMEGASNAIVACTTWPAQAKQSVVSLNLTAPTLRLLFFPSCISCITKVSQQFISLGILGVSLGM